MKSKKIWVFSLIFGMLMAFVAYIALFSNQPDSTVAKLETEKLEKVENEKKVAKAAEKEKEERKIINPIIEVSKGKRAISLKTILETGVSGYIEPNSKVDIIAYETIIDEQSKKKYKSSVLVLQNIKVLTSGKASDNNEEALHFETVTVEVTPEQGLMLSLASKDKDGFYFMLRNSKDESVIEEMKRETREVIEDKKEE
jgi:pilus assembly protein CpaB